MGTYWSAGVTKKSRALALDSGVFTWKDPRRIALSLKRSALESTPRKGTPYQSAMSMLNFYINRAGKNLPKSQRDILEKAKTGFSVIFYRKMAKTSQKTREKTREKLIHLFRENPDITIEQLAKTLDVSAKGVEWQIRQLKKQGVLRRVGPDKGGHWAVKE